MSDKFESLPDIATIQPERLIKYRLSEDKFSAEVLLPGLWYTDFDKKIGGKWSLWSIATICESMRWSGLMHGMANYPELIHGTNYTMFVASCSYQFAENIHNIRAARALYMNYPIRAISWLTHGGKTSYTHYMDLYEQKSGDKIMTMLTTIVYISKTTRRPSPWPEQFSTNLSKFLQNSEIKTVKKVVVPKIPENAYRYETKVLHSDCDLNFHTNQAIFLRWCSDAASEAAIDGHFSYFKNHIELYPMKNFEIHYIGEALVNEIVTVNTWEDRVNSKCLHFVFTKKGRIILVATMEFYDGKLTLWAIAKLFESIRYAVLEHGFVYYDRFKDDDHTIFMASTEYRYSKAINQLTNLLRAKHSWGQKYPLYSKLNVIYAGTSSFTFEASLHDHTTGEELMTSFLTFVFVDIHTRKPVPFPKWYLETKKSKTFSRPLAKIATPLVPDNAFEYEIKACLSDIDFNEHVNPSIFVKWCSDTGAEAALKGHYPAFAEDIGKYPLKKLRLKYIGEGYVRETFVVKTWQDVKDPLIIYFIISKKGKSICIAEMTFHSSSLPPLKLSFL